VRAIFIILIVFIAGIVMGFYFLGINQKSTGVGYLKGKVDIGPLCPVERAYSNDSCLPTPEIYREWPIAVYSADNNVMIAEIVPDASGTYSIELPAGKYIVDLEKPHRFGKNLPAEITIRENETTLLDIHIDTGIR